MWVQSLGIGVIAMSRRTAGFAAGSVLLGLGTAMVYPTLLAAIGDVAGPVWRASSIGVYRFWRDLGYAFGAMLTGGTAELLGVSAALWLGGPRTGAAGAVAARRVRGRRGGAQEGAGLYF